MPTMPSVAEPDVAVVRPADNVAPVGRSIVVRVPGDVEMSIDVGVASPAAVVSSCMMPTTVMAALVAAMASTFGIRRRNEHKPERCNDRKNERNLLQHICSQSERSHALSQ